MATKSDTKIHTKESCDGLIKPVRDALEVLNGKWKLPILGALHLGDSKRFKEISRELNGITDKVLSKELKELEMNKLIERKVYDTFPPTVEYSITAHGKSLDNVVIELSKWGAVHRKKIFDKE